MTSSALLNGVRVVLTSATSTSLTLGTKLQGFNAPSDSWSGAVDGAIYQWVIEANFDANGAAQDREGGQGTYSSSAGTLVRNTEWSSASANAQISITGTSHVIISPLARMFPRSGLAANTTLFVRTAAATVTMTIATPAVVSWTTHGLVAGNAVVFNTTGALPTGVTAGQIYYVIAAGLSASAFQFSATVGGTAVNTTDTQSGTHTACTGNDNNDGSSNAKANALLTLAGAAARVQTYDMQGFYLKIKLADSKYLVAAQADLFSLTGYPGTFGGIDYNNYLVNAYLKGAVYVEGNTSTPGNVVIFATYGWCLGAEAGGWPLVVDGVTLTCSGSGITCLDCGIGGWIRIGGHVVFGTVTGTSYHIISYGVIEAYFGYTISGSAYYHLYAVHGSRFYANAGTITLTGTPAWGGAFAFVDITGMVDLTGCTFSGSATGVRFIIKPHGSIQTPLATGSLTALPGNTAGVMSYLSAYDDGKFGKGSCLVYLSANQTVTAAATTKVHFDTVTYDVDGCYDNVTNFRYTVKIAGLYRVALTVSGRAAVADATEALIYLNGSQIGGGTYSQADGTGQNTSVAIRDMSLAVGDFIEGFAYNPGTTITGGPTLTYMSIVRSGDI